jgi:hypothetical protein
MVRAIMKRGFKQTESQRKLAQYKHPISWFTFSEVVRGFNQGEAHLGKLSPGEIKEGITTILEANPSLKAYINGLKAK